MGIIVWWFGDEFKTIWRWFGNDVWDGLGLILGCLEDDFDMICLMVLDVTPYLSFNTHIPRTLNIYHGGAILQNINMDVWKRAASLTRMRKSTLRKTMQMFTWNDAKMRICSVFYKYVQKLNHKERSPGRMISNVFGNHKKIYVNITADVWKKMVDADLGNQYRRGRANCYEIFV